MSGDMHDFLHSCFQKDPQRRPTARELLQHRWITYNQRTLRSSWSRTQGAKSMGIQKMDAHKSVSKVVEQILQAPPPPFLPINQQSHNPHPLLHLLLQQREMIAEKFLRWPVWLLHWFLNVWILLGISAAEK
jgi:serine/threonine protein kinase